MRNNLLIKLFRLQQYLLYRVRAKTAKGIHSPFVFDLYNSVLKDKRTYYAFEEIEAIQNELGYSDKSILVTDFGKLNSGSVEYEKRISQIVKNTRRPVNYARIFFRLANRFSPGRILELGTSLGLTTAYLALANSKSTITTLEGCPNTATYSANNWSKLKISNVVLIQGEFGQTLPKVLYKSKPLDMVFIDGHHQKSSTIKYLDMILPYTHEDSIIIMDDIHWSPGMQQAWSEIIKKDEVSVSIDLFYLGLLFRRKGQVKEHFILRF